MDDWMSEAFDESMFDDLAPSLRPDLVDALKVRRSATRQANLVLNGRKRARCCASRTPAACG